MPTSSTQKQSRARERERDAAKRPTRRRAAIAAAGDDATRSILVIDIGGTNIKLLASGQQEALKIPSGKRLTPVALVEQAIEATRDWKYQAVSMGYPGLVGPHGPHAEAMNLGPGWVGFDFAAAFGKPVKIINDAAMQAVGSYAGGRMLFLGLGTGLGSTLITNNVVIPLELGELPYEDEERLGLLVGRRGLKRVGKTRWREAVCTMLSAFMRAFVVDYLVLGGGNAKLVKDLPHGVRVGHNHAAFRGGFRLWNLDDVPMHSPDGEADAQPAGPIEWRVA